MLGYSFTITKGKILRNLLIFCRQCFHGTMKGEMALLSSLSQFKVACGTDTSPNRSVPDLRVVFLKFHSLFPPIFMIRWLFIMFLFSFPFPFVFLVLLLLLLFLLKLPQKDYRKSIEPHIKSQIFETERMSTCKKESSLLRRSFRGAQECVKVDFFFIRFSTQSLQVFGFIRLFDEVRADRISSRYLEIPSISLIYSLTFSRKKELLFWVSRGFNRLTCATRQIRGKSKLRDQPIALLPPRIVRHMKNSYEIMHQFRDKIGRASS